MSKTEAKMITRLGSELTQSEGEMCEKNSMNSVHVICNK